MPGKTLLEANRRLCEKAGDLFEIHVGTAKDMKRRVVESAGNKATLYSAKIAHADKINGNERIYSSALMGAVVSEAKKQMADGKMNGSCDHPGWDGALKDTCIQWKSMTMESDGAVIAEFSLIPGANHADHLQSLIDAGAAIGFSTRGRGRAHYPDEAERAKYNLPDDTNAVIIGLEDEYTLRAVDAVDDPSVFDAYLEPPASSDPNQKNSHTGGEPVTEKNAMFKTLAEMQEKAPELHKLHEGAITAAVEAASKPLSTAVEAEKAKNKALREATATFLNDLAEKHGIALVVEQTPAQAAARVEALKTQLQQAEDAKKLAETKLAESATKIAALETGINKAKNEAADGARRASVTAKADELLKESKFAKLIRPQIVGDGKDNKGLIADAAFDAAAAEKFIAGKTTEYEAVAAESGSDKREEESIWGVTETPKEDETSEGAGDDKKLDAARVKRELRMA